MRMTAGLSVDDRLKAGETLWYWLRDLPDWGAFTLLFVSFHLDSDEVVARLWEVWDEGTGIEDPVMFKSADPDRRPGEPTQTLRFPTVAAALSGLSAHDLSADGFGSHDDLVAAYGAAVSRRTVRRRDEPWMATAVVEMSDPDTSD
jgi:hypothetical protein